MPFNVGESVNAWTQSFLDSPTVHTIARNPIYTGIVATCVVLVIIIIVFRNVYMSEHMPTLIVRIGFWSCIALSGIVWVHDTVLYNDKEEQTTTDVFGGVFDEKTWKSLSDLPDL